MTKLCKNHGNNGLVDGAQNIVCDGNPCIARLDADKCCKPDALCGSMNAIKVQKVCGVSGQLIADKDTTSCGGLECSLADKVKAREEADLAKGNRKNQKTRADGAPPGKE